MGDGQAREGRLFEREAGGVARLAENAEDNGNARFRWRTGDLRIRRLEAGQQGGFRAEEHPGHAIRQVFCRRQDRLE